MVTVSVALKLKHYDTKTNGEVEVKFHAFLISADIFLLVTMSRQVDLPFNRHRNLFS
jgi:hypothetical protein